MDFVRTETGKSVNTPAGYELWSIPDPDTPTHHLQSPDLSMRLRSLESCFGVTRDRLLPGEEKFILRDGLTCLLKRPGKRDVRFNVPIRREKKHDTPPPADVAIISFPAVLEE